MGGQGGQSAPPDKKIERKIGRAKTKNGKEKERKGKGEKGKRKRKREKKKEYEKYANRCRPRRHAVTQSKPVVIPKVGVGIKTL